MAPRERRSRREPEKNRHFGTLTTHFPKRNQHTTCIHRSHRSPGPAPLPHTATVVCARGTYTQHRQEYCARSRTPTRRPPAAPEPPRHHAVPPTAPGVYRLYWAAAAARAITESDTRAVPWARAPQTRTLAARRLRAAPAPRPSRCPSGSAPSTCRGRRRPDARAAAATAAAAGRRGDRHRHARAAALRPTDGDSPATASEPW